MVVQKSFKDSLNMVRFAVQEKLQELKTQNLSPERERSEVERLKSVVDAGCSEMVKIIKNSSLEAKAEEKGVQ